LNFFGEYDHLVPPTACDMLSKAVGSEDVEDVKLETGHIGIYVSSKFQKLFAPKIVQWLKDRDKEDVVAPKKEIERKTVKKKSAKKEKMVRSAKHNRSGIAQEI
jgi:polyhydroxyalkanoate synthase